MDHILFVTNLMNKIFIRIMIINGDSRRLNVKNLLHFGIYCFTFWYSYM